MKKQEKSKVQKSQNKAVKGAKTTPSKKAESKVGEIWRGETKYIDPEPKKQRDFVIVTDNGKTQTVSKVKSIKVFDENGKNADNALIEINATRYGLTVRSGIDSEVFHQNRMSKNPLTVSDKRVFPDGKPRAKLGSHDKNKLLYHTGRKKPNKKKR